MADGNGIAAAWYAVVEMAGRLGMENITDLDGWDYQVDDNWKIHMNTKPNEVLHDGVNLCPFGVAVEWNGFPAGLIAPGGGIIAAGDCANEDAFIAARGKVSS